MTVHKRTWWPGVAAAFVLAAVLASACGGGSDKAAQVATQPANTAAATDRPASPAASATAKPSPSPSVSATTSASDAVVLAATKELDAVYRNPLTRDSCLQDNTAQKVCIVQASPNAALAGGLVRFTGGYPDGGGFAFLMGRAADGAWHYLYGSQQGFYLRTELPGDIRACGGGGPITIRATADANSAAAGTIADGATARAEQYTLTTAGTFGANGKRGDGWYKVSAPAAGWVHASDTADAALGDCKLRDAIEGAQPRG